MKNGSLKARQLNAIQLLALGTPIVRVAERLEVSTMTIYRWQRLPAFEAKLNAITTSGLEQIVKKLNITSLTAVETLQEVLNDMSLPPVIRTRVALGVLNALPSLNSALEKGLQHRVADFDLMQRWNSQGHTYNSSGEPCDIGRADTISV